MSVSFALIAKEPAAGRAKTRLAATVGRAAAQDIAEAMLLDSAAALAVVAPADARLVLYHDPPDAADRLAGLGVPERFAFRRQATGSLGDRLARIVRSELAAGASACVVAATDSPFAIGAMVLECVPRCRDEVVLAPCEDGGYWAVGVARTARIFDVEMSTRDVLAATAVRVRAARRHLRLLAQTLDIDAEADLHEASGRGILDRAPRTAAVWADVHPAPQQQACRRFVLEGPRTAGSIGPTLA